MSVEVEYESDFARIAEDLRRAALDARRAADCDPGSDALERKARNLAKAAARIGAEACDHHSFLDVVDTDAV